MAKLEELVETLQSATGICDVDRIQENLGFDLPQSCDALGMTVEEYEEMKRQLVEMTD